MTEEEDRGLERGVSREKRERGAALYRVRGPRRWNVCVMLGRSTLRRVGGGVVDEDGVIRVG